MDLKKKTAILFICVLLASTTSSLVPIELDTMENSTVISSSFSNSDFHSIALDQSSIIKSSDLLIGAFEILEQRLDEHGNLISISSDPKIYYGQSGGYAGIGQVLLDALQMNSPTIPAQLTTRVEEFVKDIAEELEAEKLTNASYSIWPVHNGTDLIDLSWDFGIAGISSFFVDLFDYFDDPSYLETAEKGLKYILDTFNSTHGWTSFIIEELKSNSWYPNIEFDLFYLLRDNATFTGRAFGYTGIGKAALNYMNKAEVISEPIEELLNTTISQLASSLIQNGTAIYFPNSVEVNFTSINQATGVSGIGKFYLDLYEFSNNETYLNNSIGIGNYIFGAADGVNKVGQTWIYNGVPYSSSVEFGQEHGIAGVIEYLLDIAEASGNNTYAITARNAADILLGYTSEEANQRFIGDRIVNSNILPNDKTNSWSYGGGGVFAAIYRVGEYFSSQLYRTQAEQMKNFLRTLTKEDNGILSVYTVETGLIENNPSNGLPDAFRYLTLPLQGQISVAQTSIDFGRVEEGDSVVLELAITNVGEAPIVAFRDGNIRIAPHGYTTENEIETFSHKLVDLSKI